jgi:FkbM family methyltransferase
MSLQIADVPWGRLRATGIAALSMGMLRHHVYAGRSSKRAIYRLLERRGPYYDIETDGLRFRCKVNDNGGEMVVINGRKLARRAELQQVVANLRPGDTFVDAGANFGLFTLYGAKAVGPTGRVVAIEPSSIMLERMRFNLAANGFSNVAVAAVAIGAEAGQATLHVPSTEQDRASLLPVRGQDVAQTVPVEPLVSVLAQHGVSRIDMLKIDIEGYEDRALVPFFNSAPKTLWPRRVLIERNHPEHVWKQDCIAQMLSLGYRVVWEKGRTDAMLALG